MIYAFQDQDYLYLVMDLLTGGNLRYHLTRHKKFNEEQSSNIIQYIYYTCNRIFCSMHSFRFRISS
jgi:serine/threonine protein kinase